MNKSLRFALLILVSLTLPAQLPMAVAAVFQRPVVAAKNQVVFIGTFKEGPTDKPVRITSYKEFLTKFGPLDNEYETALQVRQYFLNGGTPLTIVRAVGGATLEQPANLLTALHTLDNAGGLFLLVIPQITSVILPAVRDSLYASVLEFALNTQSFFVMDPPAEIKTLESMATWREQFPKNNLNQGAIFFPSVLVASGVAGMPARYLGASGSVAGEIATVDKDRGMWKAPVNFDLEGVTRLDMNLTDTQIQALTQDPSTGMSINALRFNESRGVFIATARTMDGASVDWRNLNVRRTVSYIETSLRNAMAWTSAEPYSSSVCNEIKRASTVFLTELSRKGALNGSRPEEAFTVLCGLGATMTAQDILAGNIRATVLVALERPAEFIEINLRLKSKIAH